MSPQPTSVFAENEPPASLVTGAAGFLGSHLADCLVAAGHKVVGLDDLSGGFTENVNPAAEFVNGSILDANLVSTLFERHRFAHVFHFAAYAAEGLSHFIRRFNYSNNVVGSVNLINAAVNSGCVRCFVFASSAAVYDSSQIPLDENSRLAPTDPYGIAKYAVELDLRSAHEIFGLDYLVFRPHNVYGERQNIRDRYRNVIGIFMSRLMQDRPMTIFGDGMQTRPFTYVQDVVPNIVRAAVMPSCYNAVYNIGSDKRYSVNDLARLVAEAMGKSPQIEYLPPRKEVDHVCPDHSKLEKVLGRHAGTPLPDGLRKMAAWAATARLESDCRSGNMSVEVARNLPGSWRDSV